MRIWILIGICVGLFLTLWFGDIKAHASCPTHKCWAHRTGSSQWSTSRMCGVV
jgi:hypothetical protein